MSETPDTPKPPERQPLYFRLTNDIPAMVWPHASGEEAIVQVGRQRPFIASRYSGNDAATMNVVIIELLARTKAIVSAWDWHAAMGRGEWPDMSHGETIDWSKENG